MYWMLYSFSITDALVAIVVGDEGPSALLLDRTIRVIQRRTT